jgi:hypothetical protein
MLHLLVSLALSSEGVRLGSARLRPQVSVGTEVHTNTYRTPSNPTLGQALVLGARAGTSWETPGFALSLEGGLEREQVLYTLQGSDTARRLSGTDLDGALRLQLAPGRRIGGVVTEELRQTNTISPTVLGGGYKGRVYGLESTTGASLRLQPGPALYADVGIQGHLERHSVRSAPEYSLGVGSNRGAAGPRGQLRWSLFPRTDLALQGGAEWFAWTGTYTNAGMGWDVSVGLLGRKDYGLVINALVGYHQLRYASGWVTPPTASVTGTAEAVWRPRPGMELAFGYDKGVEDSWYTDSLAYHYAFYRHRQVLGRRTSVELEGGYRLETLVGPVTATDGLLRGDATVTLRLAERAALEVGAGVWKRRSAGLDVPIRAGLTLGW